MKAAASRHTFFLTCLFAVISILWLGNCCRLQAGERDAVRISAPSASVYQPPIGIPAPAFGIDETAPPPPSAWPTAEALGYYYIDNTHPNATDDNAYGHPAYPRLTIPEITYAPGSYVEIHGGDYADTDIRMEFNCTRAQPCWVRGTPDDMPKISGHFQSYNNMSYVIFEYLDFDGGERSALAADGGGDHIVFRHSIVQNRRWAGNDAGVGFSPTAEKSIHDIVIYDNLFHDLGEWQTAADEDFHAVAPGLWGGDGTSAEAYNFWILENTCYHISGDCVQVNAGWAEGAGDRLHHIYVGKNLSHHNRQTGFWSKQGRDIIFSQNVSYGSRQHGGSGGSGIGMQYGPDNVWIIYNEVYDSEFGIAQVGTDGDGSEQVYIVGNVIHDNDAEDMDPCGHWSSPSGWGISVWDVSNQVYIVNNTIYNTRGGIEMIVGNTGSVHISNNIIANLNGMDYQNADQACGNFTVAPGMTQHLATNNVTNFSIDHNLFAQSDGHPIRISGFESLMDYQTASSECANCLVGAPMFVGASAGDFHLSPSSPAVDAGIEASVYQTFFDRYGLDIRVDRQRISRPQGDGWDIGAYEFLPLPGEVSTVHLPMLLK